ncbi:hypothetical protein [Hyalangium versicolor]|uniref:hypothetical protein n=1 Tax=Hyalangium versicolor TaxID=2861190 RepID=UPI001CCFA02C|nr:hypothetical protein [Hyalangium versicolor]
MVAHSACLVLLATLLSAPSGQASGLEPGSSLTVQPPRLRPAPAAEPSSRGLSLSRFLESPGSEEGRVQRTVERRLDAVENQLLPTAEEALGSALLGLAAGEATVLELVHGLHFLKDQQRTRLELRVHRELLLMELARQAGCRVDQIPFTQSPFAG